MSNLKSLKIQSHYSKQVIAIVMCMHPGILVKPVLNKIELTTQLI